MILGAKANVAAILSRLRRGPEPAHADSIRGIAGYCWRKA